jgi:antitoxin CptB
MPGYYLFAPFSLLYRRKSSYCTWHIRDPDKGQADKEVSVEDQRTIRLRRLIYQASYTGMKETDLLLGHFAKVHLPNMSDRQLDDFEALLAAGDDRIHAWVVGGDPLPDIYDTDVFHLIKNFK